MVFAMNPCFSSSFPRRLPLRSLSAMLPVSPLLDGVMARPDDMVDGRPLEWRDATLLEAVLGRLRLEAKDLRGSEFLESIGLEAKVLVSLLSLELS